MLESNSPGSLGRVQRTRWRPCWQGRIGHITALVIEARACPVQYNKIRFRMLGELLLGMFFLSP